MIKININSDVNVQQYYNILSVVEKELRNVMILEEDFSICWSYKKDILNQKGEQLKKIDPILSEKILDIAGIEFGFNEKVGTIRPYVKECYQEIKEVMEQLKPYIYEDIVVDGNYYQAKTISYDDYLRYLLMSFHSRQELNVFLSNLQKGLKRNRIRSSYTDVSAIKNGYEADFMYVSDENIGDGVHAKIYAVDKNTLIVKKHLGENPVNILYDWLKENTNVALLDIPQDIAKYESILETLNMSNKEYVECVSLWKEYFFNQLRDKGLITECECIDYTGVAPTVYVIKDDVTPELIRELRTQGIKNKEITIPVVEEIELDTEMSFLEIIETFILEDIQNESCHYNLGDPINEIFKSPIDIGNGKTTTLYPRQQIIAQGLFNAIKDGKTSVYLNGGTGIGKTFQSCKLSYAVVKDILKKDNARIVIYAQGHLIPKWQRQMNECLNPIGVYPNFYLIESYKDVLKLKDKPEGIEILLLPKDRVKRNYLYKYVGVQKFNDKRLKEISKFMKKLEVAENEVVVLREVKNLPIHLMKLAAKKIEQEYDKKVVLYKKQLNKDGKEKGYKIVTTSKLLKITFGQSNKAYDFEVENLDNFIKEIQKNLEQLSKEKRNTRVPLIQKGIICPSCGSFVYDKPSDVFDEEKFINNIKSKPNSRSRRNSKCRHFIKANGTNLTQQEIKDIRDGLVSVIYTKQKVDIPYVDEEKNPLTPEEVLQVKAGNYTGKYSILITTCGHSLWEAHEGKGYRTVNAAEIMLKRFGKKAFDVLIGDESHLFTRLSNQAFTFDKLCKLSKIRIALTATMTGGKSSDLYYQFWMMFPQEMLRRGYKYEDVNLFISHYGRRKKIVKEYISDSKYNKSGKGRTISSGWNEIPGISPLLYTHFLSGCMVSRKLEDMGIPMPPLKYFKHEVEMEKELKDGYEKLKEDMITFMKNNEELSIAGSYLHQLLSYPDFPKGEPVYWNGTDLLVATPPRIDLSNGRLLNKEKKLLETIKREVKEGRKVLVYNSYSGEKGISKRLMQIISEAGFKVRELTSSIKLEKREEWVEEQAENGVDVLITNPICVNTGLDIIQYPTIYFYNLSYDVRVVRQSEKRAWRPNQTAECRIYYSFYKETLQEDAIRLVGSKKKASLVLEGVFSEDMLSSMGSDTGESGSKVLFNVLKGKVKLDEETLDAFGFESEEDLINNNENTVTVIDEDKIEEEREKAKQIDIFTITEKEIEEMKATVKNSRKRKKIEKEVIAGQMMLVI